MNRVQNNFPSNQSFDIKQIVAEIPGQNNPNLKIEIITRSTGKLLKPFSKRALCFYNN